MDELDFEGTGVQTSGNEGGTTTQTDTTSLDGKPDTEDVTGKSNETDNNNSDNNQQEEGNNDDNNSSTGDLEVGTEVEFDGQTYTVAENGDLVDKDGKVFKEAKDIKAWLDENQVADENDTNDLSLSNIQQSIGIEITDEEGKPVEFTDDIEGVKGYINSVIELKSNELQQGAVNKLFNDNPILKQFVDYLQVNDGDPRGFGELPDRSGIQVDKDNEAQQEAIILQAAREFGNKSLNDNYIKFLKSTGGLYDEAVAQLQALQAKDKATLEQIQADAEDARREEQAKIQQYWNNVYNVVKNGVIGEYKLPDSFVKEVDGKKITLTRNDFYNYLSRATEVDENGNRITAYQRDLNNLSDQKLLEQELISAYLMFNGGSYKDLIDMAVKENEVRKLVIKSKERKATRTVKVNKPQSKASLDDIIF